MIRIFSILLFLNLCFLAVDSVFGQTTLYSYTSGDWNTATTWTTDAGGTVLVGSQVPSAGDIVVILPSRTVSLSANITTTNLDITIQAGGFLDNGNFLFTQILVALRGQGIMRISSANFPAATVNSFVQPGGGTTEYYNSASFNMPSQALYNNLTIYLSNG
ncbi:MAG TPA: hypothetical protein VHI78_04325, partial [Bacteroidales bacterium]|nr:hypothetical protein [Bacteroidales bacterium]